MYIKEEDMIWWTITWRYMSGYGSWHTVSDDFPFINKRERNDFIKEMERDGDILISVKKK